MKRMVCLNRNRMNGNLKQLVKGQVFQGFGRCKSSQNRSSQGVGKCKSGQMRVPRVLGSVSDKNPRKFKNSRLFGALENSVARPCAFLARPCDLVLRENVASQGARPCAFLARPCDLILCENVATLSARPCAFLARPCDLTLIFTKNH